MLLGITGTDGAGKGSVVDHLILLQGFVHYSSRSIILERIYELGLPDTRAQMRLTANELRAEHGDDFLVKIALEKIANEHTEHAVIESIRATAEVETLKKAGGILLAVDANQELRYDRVQSRRSESDKVTFAEFQAHEELEKNDPDPHGMQKGKVMLMADYVIMNNGTKAGLEVKVEKFLQTFEK